MTSSKYKTLQSSNVPGSKNLLVIFLFLWTFAVLFGIYYVISNQDDVISTETIVLLSKAEDDLYALKKRNIELRKILIDFNNIDLYINKERQVSRLQKRVFKLLNNNSDGDKLLRPPTKYEALRRRISNNIQEFWYFVSFEIHQINSRVNTIVPALENLLSLGSEHKYSLASDIEQLAIEDNFMDWREEEINDLSNVVQTQLHYLQNPVDCKKAKKLTCYIDYKCSFECQINSVVSCMILAYETQRTVVLKPENRNYYTGGWEKIFQPISESCTTADEDSAVTWPSKMDTETIFVPSGLLLCRGSDYCPIAVPRNLESRLISAHGNPMVWWVGQIKKYILRLQSSTADYIKDKIKQLQIKSPFVGVYLKQSQQTEPIYTIEECMHKVEDFYKQLEIKHNITKRRIYLVTDDHNIMASFRIKYSDYEIMYNQIIDSTKTSLMDLLLDVHILSQSDFVVCPFSLDMCRLAYELMQTYHIDASNKFASLDDIYFYSREVKKNGQVVLMHEAERPEEINLSPGDIIDIKNNFWDGYSLGTNLKTNKTGFYPSFKVDL